jgi:hypothetical protein
MYLVSAFPLITTAVQLIGNRVISRICGNGKRWLSLLWPDRNRLEAR